MADTKISAMTAATTPLAGTEVLPIVQSSANRKVAVSDLTAGRSVSATSFVPTGSTVPANGTYLPAANTLGWATASTARMQIDANGCVGIGGAAAATVGLFLQKNITGGTTALGIAQNATIQSGVTGAAIGYQSSLTTAAAAFTNAVTINFYVSAANGLGAGSAITTENGYVVANDVRRATTTNGFLSENTQLITAGKTYYGFRSQTVIASGGGTTWSLYFDGNAPCAFSGLTRFGATTAPVNTVDITGSLGRGAPVTKTTDFTLAATENWVISDRAATNTVTLPAASSWTGREVMFKTVQAQTLVSASSNVVPLAGGAAGTAILAATAGKWATLVSDGTNWIIMQGA